MLVWKKLASAKWEDAWQERLAFLETRLVISALPNSKSIRLEGWDVTAKEAKALETQFGGKTQQVNAREIIVKSQGTKREAINIRGVLRVADRVEAKLSAAERERTIIIPAGMAFGTGEHATTASCLRLLVDVVKKLPRETKWQALDLGTGSGILAIAARKLGAAKVLAGDYDPEAVRVSKENAAANGTPEVKFQKFDLTTWTPKTTYEVVLANVFSGILIETSGTITKCLKPGGSLILSGILRAQEPEVVAAFAEKGLRLGKAVRKGKWVALLLGE
ncbi:MAG: 50S ribosomal protein L11 methyltransferase [Chthoniobacteraceae bacterium]